MPLVIRMKVGEGFVVGETRVELDQIVSSDTFVLQVGDDRYEVGTDWWVPLIPGCSVRSTLPHDPTRRSSSIKVEVNAPNLVVYRVNREGVSQWN